MRATFKRIVSFALVMVLVFSAFTILPGELFHSFAVDAAETVKSASRSIGKAFSELGSAVGAQSGDGSGDDGEGDSSEEAEDPVCEHDYALTGNLPATCTEPERDVYTCSVCGDVKYDAGRVYEIDPSKYFESAHPYQNGANQSWTLNELDAEYYEFTFSEGCVFENSYDKLSFYDRKGNLVTSVTGTVAADYTVRVNSSECRVVLTTDGSIVNYGFRFDSIKYRKAFKPLGHDYTEISNKQPTCTEKGEKTYRCTRCGDEYTSTGYDVLCDKAQYPQSAHTYANSMDYTWFYSQEGAESLDLVFYEDCAVESSYDRVYVYDSDYKQVATYTGGFANQKLKVTGDSFYIRLTSDGSVTTYGFSFESITAHYEHEPVGHKYELTEVVPPNCSENGLGTYRCTVCGDIRYDEGEDVALDRSEYPESKHNYDNNCDVSWTFSHPGTDHLVLNFSAQSQLENGCDKLYIYDSKGNLVHTLTGLIAGKSVRVNDNFFRIRLTSDYSATYYGFSFESIMASGPFGATGHSFTDYVPEEGHELSCTDDGNAVAQCDYGCGATDTKKIAAIGHSFTNYVDDGNTTCTANGTKTAVCDHGCGTKDVVINPAFGHDWDDGVVTESTCSVRGRKVYTCKTCGTTRTEYLEPGEHSYAETYVPENCTDDAYYIYTCENCGDRIVIRDGRMTDPADYPESDHSYGNNEDKTWDYSYDGADELVLTFTGDSYLEPNHDYIYIYDKDGALAGSFSGSLSQQSCTVSGDSFRIKLTSDSEGTAYGFRLSSIIAKYELPKTAGHQFSVESEDDAANTKHYTCDVCGYSYTTADPPAKIDNVTATPSETAIAISWQVSKEANTTKYRVYRKAEDENKFTLLARIDGRDNKSYTDSNVVFGKDYSYYVVGVDIYRQESETWDVVTSTLNPDVTPPVFESMTPASNSAISKTVTFAITARDNVNLASAEIYYSTASDAPVESWTRLEPKEGSLLSQKIDTTEIPDGYAFVKVRLTDASGNSSWSPAYRYLCDNTGPEKIQNLRAEAVGGTTITLAWDDVSDNDISYFVVEAPNASGEWTYLYTVTGELGINIGSLTPETSYTYRVVGYDIHSNRGAESEPLTVTTTPDTIEPKVTAISPAPGYFRDTIPLSFTAVDDYKVVSLEIQASPDKKNWVTVDTLTSGDPGVSRVFTYNLDLSEYPEGSLYVRGVVEDSYGNRTPDSDSTIYEYVVDRQAPALPTGIKADSSSDGSSSFVCVSWNPVTGDNSFAYYRVYRSGSEDGEYTLIKNNLTTVNTYDTGVEFGETYFYKLECVDLAGNVSEKSEAVSCKVIDDTESPVILPVSPYDGAAISSRNNSITIAATDNARVKSLKAEYKTNAFFSDYKTLGEVTDNKSGSCSMTLSLPLDEFGNGTEVTLRITAADTAGNEAEETTVTYVIDTEAPEIGEVSLSATEDNLFTCEWSCTSEDVSYFYIYRKTASASDFTLYDSVRAQAGQTSYRYTDDGVEIADKSVQYKIEAFDPAGNSSSKETEAMNVNGANTIAPIAVLDCQPTVVCDSEYVFDGSHSTDDGSIVSYRFDFGDGTDAVTNTSGKAKHIFTEKGTFTVTLQATDNDGNVGTDRKTVTVTGRELVGRVNIIIKDDKGSVLPGTDVYADIGEENAQHAVTDYAGCAMFELSVGSHVISSYKNSEYLPVKQDITVTGNDITVTLVLINEPIVTGEFEIHRMTFDEIVAAGIDINAAENRNVVRIDVTLVYERVPIKSVIYWNGETAVADPIYVRSSSGVSRKLTPYVIGGGSGSGSGGWGGGAGSGSVHADVPTIVYIDVPVEFSYLKEFFDVSLHIINHASEDFSLLNNTVKLNVPDGLTIVKTNSSQPKANVYIDEIKGQSQATVNWVLRGDKAGSYKISADYLGILSYFNEPISAKFIANDEIEVHDSSAVEVEIEASESSYSGRVFYNTVVKNNGELPLNDFRWTPLIESFTDEYVDSSGNVSEMATQRSTLNPGEKFIYHYFTETGSFYKYIGNMIDDLNANGAKVTVTTHKADYFLPAFYEKFPEEAGDFVIEVIDSSGNPVENAEIELTETTRFKTDNPKQKGRVIIPKEERNTTPCSYLKVTAEGYYGYVDNDFHSVAFGKKETVKLYRVGEYAVESVTLDNRDVISGSANIITNKEDRSATFVARIYGEIKSVEVVQSGKALKAQTETSDSSQHTFTRVIPVSGFENGKPVSLRVTQTSGEVDVIDLNARPMELVTNPNIELPSSMDLSLENSTGNSSLDWLNWIDLSVPISDKAEIGIEYDEDEQMICFLLDCGLFENDYGDDGPDDFTIGDINPFHKNSDAFEAKVREYVNGIGDIPDDFGRNFSVGIGGVIGFRVNDNGTLGELARCSVFLKLEGSYGYNADFVVGAIPLTLGITLTAGVSAELNSVKDAETHAWELSGRIGASIELEASIGLGISCLNFSVYGSMGLESGFVFGKNSYIDDVVLSGEFGFSVKFFWLSKKYPILSEDCKIYDHEEARKKAASAVADSYVIDGYEVNRDLLTCGSVWAEPVNPGDKPSALLENAFAGEAPNAARIGDKLVMVYQGIDREADCAANALALYFTVYDPATQSWSVPEKLDDNHNADLSYSLEKSGDKLVIVYTQCSASLTDETELEDALSKVEVYAAVFSPEQNTFTDNTRITDNQSYDALPYVRSVGGVPTAVWVNSSSNNAFLNDGENTIMTSSLTANGWSAPSAAVSGVNTPVSVRVLSSSDGGKLVYATDRDNDLTTADDREIILCDISGENPVKLAQNIETVLVPANIGGSDSLLWYQNGGIKKYGCDSGETENLFRLPALAANGIKTATDDNGNTALVFADTRNSLSAVYYNASSGEWSKPVTVAQSENFIENFTAEFTENKLSVSYYDTEVTDAEAVAAVSTLMTVNVDSEAKPAIGKTDINLYNVRAGEQAELDVDVTNNGFAPSGDLTFTVTGYDGSVIGTLTADNSSIGSGDTKTFAVPFTAPEIALNRDLTVTVSDGTSSSSARFTLAKADLGVHAEQYDKDGQSFIKTSVYNNYIYSTPAAVEIYDRATGGVLASVEISNVTNSDIVTVYIPLDEAYADADGNVAVRVVSKTGDDNSFNDTSIFSYRKNSVDSSRVLIGDVDFDGLIDVIDATITQKIVAAIITPNDKLTLAADVNGDGVVNINDVTAIQKNIALTGDDLNVGDSSVFTETVNAQDTLIKATSVSAYPDGDENIIRFVFTRNVLDSYTMVSHGVLYGTSASTFGSGKADEALRFADSEGKTLMSKVKNTVIKTSSADGVDGFTINVASRTDGVVYARGYVILEDSKGNHRVVYSDVISGSFDDLR